jgi:phage tail-like protein
MTKLLDYLPPVWRSGLERGVAQAVGHPLDVLRTRIDARIQYIDPNSAPDEWLDWLMVLVALPLMVELSGVRKRNLIRLAWTIWSRKGSSVSLEQWVQAVAGVDASVVNLNIHAFVADVSQAGDMVGSEADMFRYEIRIEAGSIDVNELSTIVDIMAPSIALYRIVDFDNNVLLDFPA